MKLSQLQKKYPNAFKLFKESKDARGRLHNINGVLLSWTLEHDVRMYWKEITDFMDKRGIPIYIERWEGFICPHIHLLEVGRYRTRKPAETKAIKESFKILESRP